MLLLLNAGAGLALAYSGKGPLYFQAYPLWEEVRLGNLFSRAVLCAVLFVLTPFWRILAVSILLLIPLPRNILLTHEVEYLDPPSCLLANYCHYLARQTCHEIRIFSQNRVISGSSGYPVLCKSVTAAAERQFRFCRIHTLPGGKQKSNFHLGADSKGAGCSH